MTEPIWVQPETAIAAHQVLIAEHGGLSGIRDPALLESALARPQQLFAYGEKISVCELAASYSYGFSKNHPFIDGNKRIALTIGAVFLELNGYSLDAPEPEAVIIFEQLAAGRIDEPRLAKWFEDFSVSKA